MINFAKEELGEKISQSRQILIALPSASTFDEVAAGLALFLSFQKAGKMVQVLSNFEPTVELSPLVGIDKIKTQSGGGNFVISIKDALGSIEKVTHYLDGETLNLVLHPLSGGSQISEDKVSFSRSGYDSELIFLIGLDETLNLGKFNLSEEKISSSTTFVLLSNKLGDLDQHHVLGNSIRVLAEDSSCMAEIVTFLIKELNLPHDSDICHNLFQGLHKATNGFSVPPASSQTFELASWCLRNIPSAILTKLPKMEMPKMEEEASKKDLPPEEAPPQKLVDVSEEAPPADWLKPKILKSSS